MDSDDEASMEPLRRDSRIGKNSHGKNKVSEDCENEYSCAERATKKRRTATVGQMNLVTAKQKVGFKCSPHLMHELFQRLNEDQKRWVQEIGFGALISMPSCVLPKGLTLWLVKHVSWKRRSLVVRGRSIKINNEIKKILGIPDGFLPVPFPRTKRGKPKGSKSGVKDTVLKDAKSGRGLSYKTTLESLVVITDPVQFKRTFMLYVLCIYFAPSSGLFINKSYASIIDDVDLIKDMNWCDHVAEVLLEGVREYRDSKAVHVNVHGCVHVLLLIYIDMIKSAFIKVPDGTPRAIFVNSVHLEHLDYHDLKFTTHEGPEYGKLEIGPSNEDIISLGEGRQVGTPGRKYKAGDSSPAVPQEPRKVVIDCIARIEAEYIIARERAYEECFTVLRDKMSKIDTIRSTAISEVHEKLFQGRIMASPSTVSRQSGTIARKEKPSPGVEHFDSLFSTPGKQSSLTKVAASPRTAPAEKVLDKNADNWSAEFSFQFKPTPQQKYLLSKEAAKTSCTTNPAADHDVCPPAVPTSPESLDLQQPCLKFSTLLMISKERGNGFLSPHYKKRSTLFEDHHTPAIHPRDTYDSDDPLGFDIMSGVAAEAKECEGQALFDALNDSIRNPDPAEGPFTCNAGKPEAFEVDSVRDLVHDGSSIPATVIELQNAHPAGNYSAVEGLPCILPRAGRNFDHYYSRSNGPCSQPQKPILNTIIEDKDVALAQQGSDLATGCTFTKERSRAHSPSSDSIGTVLSPVLHMNEHRSHVLIATAACSHDPFNSINQEEEMQPSSRHHSGNGIQERSTFSCMDSLPEIYTPQISAYPEDSTSTNTALEPASVVPAVRCTSSDASHLPVQSTSPPAPADTLQSEETIYIPPSPEHCSRYDVAHIGAVDAPIAGGEFFTEGGSVNMAVRSRAKRFVSCEDLLPGIADLKKSACKAKPAASMTYTQYVEKSVYWASLRKDATDPARNCGGKTIIRIRGVHLTEEEFVHTLRPDGEVDLNFMWLCSLAVMLDWASLTRTILKQSVISELMKPHDSCDHKKIAYALKRLRIDIMDQVYLPVRIKLHWILIIISISAEVFEIYDALRPERRPGNRVDHQYQDTLDTIGSNLQIAYYEATSKEVPINDKFRKKEAQFQSTIICTNDTGIEVIRLLACHNGKDLMGYGKKNMVSLRKEISHTLINNRFNDLHPEKLTSMD